MIKFSVVMPIYNTEKYVVQSIESVLKQTYEHFELILVDDGSPDRCPKICDEYAQKDDRIKVIHKKNGGLPVARNSGIEIADGDYYMHLDSDDYWDDKALKKVADAILVDPGKDIYIGSTMNVRVDNRKIETILFRYTENHRNDGEQLIDWLLKKNKHMPAYAYQNVYSAHFIKSNNIKFDETLTWAEDADYFFNAIFKARKIGVVDYPFYNYRVSAVNSMTKNPSEKNCRSRLIANNRWFNFMYEQDDTVGYKGKALSYFGNANIKALIAMGNLKKEQFYSVLNSDVTTVASFNFSSGIVCRGMNLLGKIAGYYFVARILCKAFPIYMKIRHKR